MNKSILTKALLAFSLPLLFQTASFAEDVKSAEEKPSIDSEINDKDLSLEELLNIEVVSASKKAESINTAPSTVYVVTEKDIASNGYYDLKDVLENIPGVTTIDLGFFLFGGQRGYVSNFSQTLLMINGREVQNLIAAETFISNQFATHNIKRVEVIQGPASALYGANALVGVINIITKESDKSYDKVEAQVEVGSNNRKAFDFVFGKNFGDLRISGSSRLFASDSYDFSNFVSDTKKYSAGTPAPAQVKKTTGNSYTDRGVGIPLSLRLDYKWFYLGTESYFNKSGKGQENVSLDFNSQYDVRDFSMYYGGFNYDFNERNNINIEYQHTNEKFWGVNYTFNQATFDKLVAAGRDPNTPLTSDEIFKNFADVYSQENSTGSKRDRINAQYNSEFRDMNLSLFNDIDLTAGYTFDRLDLLGVAINANDLSPGFNETVAADNPMRRPFYTTTKNSGFLQLKKSAFDQKLNVTLGGRLDYHSIYGLIPTFRSGIVLNPLQNTYIKALFGQAFREPNIFELGALNSDIDTSQRGAITLKPSNINTYEASILQIFNNYLQANVTFYRNDAANFIEPLTTREFKNSSDVKTSIGLESQLFFKLPEIKINNMSFGTFSGDANYSLTIPTWTDTVMGKQVPALGVYRNRVNFGLNYDPIDHLRLNTRINFYDSIQAFNGNKSIDSIINIDPFAKVNVTALLHGFNYNGVNVSLEASIKNLFDGQFFQPNVRRGGPNEFMLPGREFVGRLIFEF